MKIFKYSFAKIFKGKEFSASICIVLLLSIVIPIMQFMGADSFSQAGMLQDAYYFNSFDESQMLIVIFLLPIFAGYITSNIVDEDKKIASFVHMRCSKYAYYFITIGLLFAWGFFLMNILNILIMLYSYIILNFHNTTDIYYNGTLVEPYNYQHIIDLFAFGNIYITNPFVRIIVYNIILSVYSGIMFIFGYSVNIHCKNKYLGYILPFVLTALSMQLCVAFQLSSYVQKVVDPQMLSNPQTMATVLGCILLISFVSALYYYKKKENS